MKYLLLFLVLALFSCQKVDNIDSDFPIYLYVDDTVSIKTDSLTNYFSLYSFYENDTLFFLNEPSNQLKFLSVSQGQTLGELNFSRSGPNGVRDVYSCEKIGAGKYAITNTYAKSIFLIDSHGVVVGEFSIKDALKDAQVELYPAAPSSRTILALDSLLILPVVPKFYKADDFNRQKEIIASSPTHLILNLLNGKVRPGETRYPKDLGDRLIPSLYFSPICTYNPKSKCLVSIFQVSDSVFIENLVTKEIKKEMVRSGFFEFPQNYTAKENSDETNTLIERPEHKYLMFDKYRDYYYLINKLEYSGDKELISNDPAAFYALPFSICVLDSSFKTLEEKDFKEHHMINSNLFLSKDGLYISNNSPSNPHFREETLQYVKFNFKRAESK